MGLCEGGGWAKGFGKEFEVLNVCGDSNLLCCIGFYSKKAMEILFL